MYFKYREQQIDCIAGGIRKLDARKCYLEFIYKQQNKTKQLKYAVMCSGTGAPLLRFHIHDYMV